MLSGAKDARCASAFGWFGVEDRQKKPIDGTVVSKYLPSVVKKKRWTPLVRQSI